MGGPFSQQDLLDVSHRPIQPLLRGVQSKHKFVELLNVLLVNCIRTHVQQDLPEVLHCDVVNVHQTADSVFLDQSNILELVPEKRHSDDWFLVVDRLVDAQETSVGDEETKIGIG